MSEIFYIGDKIAMYWVTDSLGDSDVGDIVMMVTDFRCQWQNHYVGDFFRHVRDFLNVLNRSPTSQTFHQHIWSSTSFTDIDVSLSHRHLKTPLSQEMSARMPTVSAM